MEWSKVEWSGADNATVSPLPAVTPLDQTFQVRVMNFLRPFIKDVVVIALDICYRNNAVLCFSGHRPDFKGQRLNTNLRF